MTEAHPIVTREIAAIPRRRDDAHKGDVGRIALIGGCCSDTMMVGAPALAANAAFRSGAGLVQLIVPEAIRSSVAVLAPCGTLRSLPGDADAILDVVQQFGADVLAIGPGLGDSIAPSVVGELLTRFPGPVVIDADGLNRLADAPLASIADAGRIVMTPHPGEMRRLLAARGNECTIDGSASSRKTAALALVEAYGCTAVLKGRGTIVADGQRMYINQTGNAGMATGGTGDVLTGVIAALIGQRMDPFDAAVLAVYLHGLAGDFAAEELGRWSMTATDIIDYLPEAFCEHDMSTSG